MSYEPLTGTGPARAIAYLKTLPPGKEISTAELAEAIDYDKGSLASSLATSKHYGLVVGRIPKGALYTMWSIGKGVRLSAPTDADDDEPIGSAPAAPPTTASSVFDIARGASEPDAPPARGSRQVLKAEAATPDATDRDAPVTTGPGVGPMGAGQAADAAPDAGQAPQLRFALWSDGALQIQRAGNDCVVLARSETEARAPITGRGGIPARHAEHESRPAGVVAQPHELGRWPANLIHDGSDEVLASFPLAPGQIADAKRTGERKTANVYGTMRYANGRDGEASASSDNDGAVGFKMKPGARRADAGSAARFFYCAKASRSDRNAGTESLPQRVAGMVSNTSGQHITRRDEGYEQKPQGNHHPTVKPTDLMRYLCRLVTPPGGVVLDPFMGSGSTGKAAVLEGFGFVGIEREAEYVEIARQRISSACLPLFAEVAHG